MLAALHVVVLQEFCNTTLVFRCLVPRALIVLPQVQQENKKPSTRACFARALALEGLQEVEEENDAHVVA